MSRAIERRGNLEETHALEVTQCAKRERRLWSRGTERTSDGIQLVGIDLGRPHVMEGPFALLPNLPGRGALPVNGLQFSDSNGRTHTNNGYGGEL